MKSGAPRTVLLALGDMTSAGLLARIKADTLPAIAALAERGVRAPVAPGDPAAAGLWPTVATGLPVERHGILLADERWAGGLRPSGRSSWRAPPYWERLAQAGIATIGVGWPHTAPGAAWSADIVDDRLGIPTGETWDEWLLPPDVAAAPLREMLRETRVHPTDIKRAMLRPFVPAIDTVDQFRDRRLVDLALAVARFSSDLAAFRVLLAERPWQMASLCSGLIGTLLKTFEDAAAPFDTVVNAGWTVIDSAIAMLGATLPDATIMLLSPGRLGQAGLLVAAGPGLPAGIVLPPLRAIDIAPSLLARFGLADAALPGAARLNAPKTLRPLPPALQPATDPAPDAADLARVMAFGFAPPRQEAAITARRLLTRGETLLASRPAEAKALAEQALALQPEDPAAIGLIAASEAAVGDFANLSAHADRIAAVAPDHLWVPLIRAGFHASRRDTAAAIPLLRQVEAAGGPLEWMRAAAAWMMLRRPAEARRLFEKIAAQQPDAVSAIIGIGLTSAQTPFAAEQAFRRALALDPDNAIARDGLARTLRRVGRSAEAARLTA